MAKKVLTPEQAEIKALKKAKKSENWTKFWAIALALVLTIGVVFLGQSAGKDAVAAAVNGTNAGTSNSGSSDDTGSTDAGSTDTGSTDAGTNDAGTNDAGNAGGNAGTAVSKAEVAKAFNDATAKAAKGSYEMERVCGYQPGKGIKVTMLGGDATSVLNGVITAVDENATLDSVVGGFLGVGTKKIKVTNGVGQRYGSDGTMADLNNEEKDYILKAMTLTEADLATATKDGNTYTFTLAKIADPQKDGKNAMHHATNDFITESQVKTAIGSITDAITVESAKVNYYDIKFVATIENGTLKNLTMNYKADAVMKLKVAMTIDGTGSMEVKTTYTF